MKKNIVVFDGKRYPRRDSEFVSLSEAMARMGSTQYEELSGWCHLIDIREFVIFTNDTDAPEGIEQQLFRILVLRENWHGGVQRKSYWVRKDDLNSWLVNHGRPACDPADSLADSLAEREDPRLRVLGAKRNETSENKTT